jgi:NAD(P)-dependent dehydrogenase (short-subunit alcohol dehydrogenase family)
MQPDVSDRPPTVAVVTGAGGGIGRAISLRLAEDGLAVGVLDIVRESAEATAALVTGQGGKAVAVVADICQSADIERALDEVSQALGLADVLVNNAGALSLGPFQDISESEWDRAFKVNLKAPFFLTQRFATRLKSVGQRGSVVNIGSVAAKRVMTNRAHYCASKGGVQALTKGQALELAPLGIRVNCVNPKGILSGMSGRWTSAVDGTTQITEGTWYDDPAQRSVVMQSLPLAVDEPGSPEDIANAVSFLVSERSSWMTGACIDVDGGYLAGDMFTR